MKKFTVLFILISISIMPAFSQWNYPKTKTVDASDKLWGVTYNDPYRWLEDVNQPEVAEWYKEESAFSDSVLNKISGRDELVAEWEKLDKLQPPRINGRVYQNGRIFYKKTMPGENVAKLYYREGMYGKEILLFDPTAYIPGKTLSITSSLPSWDGKMVALSYAEGGVEISTIIVMEVDSKNVLPFSIFPSWGGVTSWTFDNKAFTYFLLSSGDVSDPDLLSNTKTKLHVLGTDIASDVDFFSRESYPSLGIQTNDMCVAYLRDYSKNYVFANLYNVRQEIIGFYAPVSEFNSPDKNWKVLCTADDKLVRGMVIIGDDVYAITYHDAPNYKLLHTSLSNPDWENANVIAPERNGQTLESIDFCRDYLFLVYSDGINNQLYKYHFKTKTTSEVKLPYTGTTGVFCLDKKTNDCFVVITSWTRPFTEFSFNAENDEITPSKFNEVPEYPDEYKDLVVEEVQAKGHDGEMVPLTIVYKKGTEKNGNNVCLMEGYGAYGYSMTPYFDYRYNSLAVKGVVIAFAHTRGGSEKGDTWYKAGYKTTKPNTWKDFNSCAEYLIANKYTSAKKMAGTGTSAGGILISRAITSRPDLYAAAICNVGCANAMRMETAPNGPTNIPEFGTVADSLECLALYEMDGTQHVKKGTKYPAVICVGGWNDPRVAVWEPAKFAAALQNATASDKPVLMKVNYDNGHFTEEKTVTFKDFANQFAFVLWQCGQPGFEMMEQQ